MATATKDAPKKVAAPAKDHFGFRLGSNRAKAAKLLSDKPITMKELIAKAKVPPVARMLWEMTQDKLLANDGEGYYLTKKGLAVKANGNGKAAK